MTTKRSEREIKLSAYEAYLIARATGRSPTRLAPAGDEWSLLERYAVALGVHHYFAGTEPISADLLCEKAEACVPSEDEGSAEMSTDMSTAEDVALRAQYLREPAPDPAPPGHQRSR